jgi:hypothetical protein
MTVYIEDRVVRAFMDHVSGNDHAMAQQQNAG